MTSAQSATRINVLLVVLLAQCAASLFHHVHNAVFLTEYPNLPAWLTPQGVYVAWLGETAIGVAGYLLFHRGYPVTGLALLGIYGLFGLYGLAHYAVASMSAHTLTMNLSIWIEVVTGVLLLATVAGLAVRRFRRNEKGN